MTSPFFDAERLIRLGRVSSFAVAPDGSWAAVAVQRLDGEGGKYLSGLWRAPLDGSAATRLTRGDSDDSAPCFRQDGVLGFLSNRRPNEKPGDRRQVWLLDPTGGDPWQLTDEPLGVTEFRFAARAPVLICVAPTLIGVDTARQRTSAEERKSRGPTLLRYTAMPVRFWDHWMPMEAAHLIAYSDDGEDRRDLTPLARREHTIELTWALDAAGRFVIATSSDRGKDRVDDTALVRIDVASGEHAKIVGGDHIQHASPVLSDDGRWLASTRHRRSCEAHGPIALVLTDLASNQSRLLKGLDAWLTPQCFSADGMSLFTVGDQRGTTPVFRVDLETGAVDRITVESSGGHHSKVLVVPHRGQLAVLRNTFFEPPDLFIVEPFTASTPHRVSDLSGFDSSAAREAVSVESIEVESAGRLIQAWVVGPRGRTTPGPGLLWIHGGPHAQWSDAWHWRWNVLLAVAQGYTLAMPNPAGSTGFGQQLVEDVFGNRWGDLCYRDVMAVADRLETYPGVDPAHIAAMGGSFGGYMTSWIGVNTTRFAALVTHAGLFDLNVFHGTTDCPAWLSIDLGGLDPDKDRDAFIRWSPRQKADQWKTPVLILHGEKDYRVPVSEALVLFEALDARGVDAELGIFPDENHWILRPRNVVAWYGIVFDFLGRHTTA